MKQSYKNINLAQKRQKGKTHSATLRWIVSLKKTGGMARKLRRDGR